MNYDTWFVTGFLKIQKKDKTVNCKVIPMLLVCCFKHRDICVSIFSLFMDDRN